MSSPHQENDDQNNAGRRLYNPYQDLNFRHQTLYNLPTSPEHLFIEESMAQNRSWGENVTFYTGCSVLSGAVLGGGQGLRDGVRSFERGDTTKLKASRILSSSGAIGGRYANRAGVVGLLFSFFEGGMGLYRDKDDALNTVGAGLMTGAVFRIAHGSRAIMIASAVGGVMGGLVVAGKQVIKRYVPI